MCNVDPKYEYTIATIGRRFWFEIYSGTCSMVLLWCHLDTPGKGRYVVPSKHTIREYKRSCSQSWVQKVCFVRKCNDDLTLTTAFCWWKTLTLEPHVASPFNMRQLLNIISKLKIQGRLSLCSLSLSSLSDSRQQLWGWVLWCMRPKSMNAVDQQEEDS